MVDYIYVAKFNELFLFNKKIIFIQLSHYFDSTNEVVGSNGEISDIESKNFFCYFFCSFKTIEKLALFLIMYSGKLKSTISWGGYHSKA